MQNAYEPPQFELPEDAVKFLKGSGFRLTTGFSWLKPHPNYVPTPQETRAVRWLIEEWDFGGIIGTRKEPFS